MSNCKMCKNLGCAMRGSDWTPNPAIKCYGYEPMTNGDIIRAKSDYDLADWIADILHYHGELYRKMYSDMPWDCDTDCPLCKCCNDQPGDTIEDWLKSPVDKEMQNNAE